MHDVADLVRSGEDALLGVMLPSFLLAGRQDLVPGQPSRAYGMSVTEPCLDWAATADALKALAAASHQRRKPAPAAKKPRV